MSTLEFFIQDNKKKIIIIIIFIILLTFIAIRINKKENTSNEVIPTDTVVDVSIEEMEKQKDLELRGGDPFALPNYNLIEPEEVITEVYKH